MHGSRRDSNFLGISRAGGLAMRRRGGKNPKPSSEWYYAVSPRSFHPGAWSCMLSAPSPLLLEEVLSVLRGGSWETEFAKLPQLWQGKCTYRLGKAKDTSGFKKKKSSFKTVTEQIIQKFIFSGRVYYLVYTRRGDSLWWRLPGYHGRIVQFFLLHLE